jgi:transposase
MQYSQSIREQVMAQALAGEKSQAALAKEFGIGVSTLQNWLRQYRRSGASTLSSNAKSPQSWSRAQRLDALLETHALSAEERGAWCRAHGVHTHQLEQWRREFADAAPATSSDASESRALRQELKSLKGELRRKERALAETAALLVLKKKAAAIWGESEDD